MQVLFRDLACVFHVVALTKPSASAFSKDVFSSTWSRMIDPYIGLKALYMSSLEEEKQAQRL